MNTYQEMMDLLDEYKQSKPEQRDGVFDYSPESMARHHAEMGKFRGRWDEIETAGWSCEHRNDAFTVLGQINVGEYMCRYLRPWVRDPAFYCSYPTWEANMEDSVAVPRDFPMSEEELATFCQRIAVIPAALAQAKCNLTEVSRDLAMIAIKRSEEQLKQWNSALEKFQEHHAAAADAVETLIEAVGDFKEWLESNLESFTAPAGVGKEGYNWLLKHVHFLPYDWDQAWALVRRELARSKVALKLQEIANDSAGVPPMRERPTTAKEGCDRFLEAQDTLLKFVEKHNLFPGENHIVPQSGGDPDGPPPDTSGSFFWEVLTREHLPLFAHDLFGHSPDEGYRKVSISEYRCGSMGWLEVFRSEGMATSIEEVLVQMGLVDDNPRAKEMNSILVAFRAARAMSELKMINNELNFQEGIDYTVKHTPRGYSKDDRLAWTELQCYLRFTGYGLGYLIGKVQMDQLISDYIDLKGDAFEIGEFYQNFLHRGRLPIALLRWEMTGLDDEMKLLELL